MHIKLFYIYIYIYIYIIYYIYYIYISKERNKNNKTLNLTHTPNLMPRVLWLFYTSILHNLETKNRSGNEMAIHESLKTNSTILLLIPF